MKKLTKLITSIVLILCLSFAFACSKPSKFDGNFSSEATSEQIETFTQSVDVEKLLAKTILGINLDAKIAFSIDETFEAEEGTTLEETATKDSLVAISVGMGFKLLLTQQENDMDVKGESDITIDVNDSETLVNGTKESSVIKNEIGMYLDVENGLLLDTKSTTVEDPDNDPTNNEPEISKEKIPFETIVQSIQDFLGQFIPQDASTGEGDGSGANAGAMQLPSATEISAILEAYGLKLYIDDSNGYKIKLSITEDTLNLLLAEIAGDSSQLPTVKLNKGDLYIAISKDGALEGVKIDMDVEITSSLTSSVKTETTVTKIDVDLVLDISDGSDIKIETPENIEDYQVSTPQ
ncbi:MAG: hypothetical protein E7369_06075 [Clostridiales bacterium]|nr:hypothetical protein [Clostridiales bacterium]